MMLDENFDTPDEIVSLFNFPQEPVKWDFVLSCAEPLRSVTGGIGTYSRMLLEQLAKDLKNILVFTANDFDPADLPSGITIVSLRTTRLKKGRNTHNLSDELMVYSFHLSSVLLYLQNKGHRFETTEFPDYGNDGYFSLCMRKAGILDIGNVYIRLHSPHFMLEDDNLWPSHLTPLNIIEHGAAERFVIEEADGLLYGGSSMLDRVLNYFASSDRGRLYSKAINAPHPWPIDHKEVAKIVKRNNDESVENGVINLGLIGRLEVRKGTLIMLEMLKEQQILRPRAGVIIRFHFIGATTTDWEGRKLEDIAREQIWREKKNDYVKFHGKIDQKDLPEQLEKLDGAIYPSRFENYPNALLEFMQLGKPVMVSIHGCMPMLTSEYPDAVTFDPLEKSDFRHKFNLFIDGILAEKLGDNRRLDRQKKFEARAIDENVLLRNCYQQLVKKSRRIPAKRSSISVSFVVPFYNHANNVGETLLCLSLLMKDNDEIIVVDDCSKPEELEELKLIVSKFQVFVKIIAKQKNEGPGSARNDGFLSSNCDAIQFLDADDLLDASGFAAARMALELDAKLDVIFGYQECFGGANHIWVPTRPSLEISFVRNFAHSAPLIRKTALLKMGGYPTINIKHYEDWAFNLAMMLNRLNILIIPVPTHKYRIEAGASRSTTNIPYEHISFQKMIEWVGAEMLAGGSNYVTKAWSRSVGRSWLFERGSAIMSNENRTIDELNIVDIEEKAAERAIVNAIKAKIGDHEIGDRIKIINSRLNKIGRQAQIKLLRKVKFFDVKWYVRQHEDLVALSFGNSEGYDHYHDHGYAEGRNPTPYINGRALKKVIGQYIEDEVMANPIVLYAEAISSDSQLQADDLKVEHRNQLSKSGIFKRFSRIRNK